MAFVGNIKVNAGETVDSAIETYLALLSLGFTNSQTAIEVSDLEYPVGYFTKDTIDVFKIGLNTVSNLHYLLDIGEKPESEKFKSNTRFFIEKLFENKNDLGSIFMISEAFDEIMLKSTKTHMFDEEDKKFIIDQLKSNNSK